MTVTMCLLCNTVSLWFPTHLHRALPPPVVIATLEVVEEMQCDHRHLLGS